MRVRNAILCLFATLLIGTVAYAQPSHPNSPHDTIKTKDITVTYGRPYKKGRETFGGTIAPYGKVYRCGADEATTITFAKDATFGGKPIKAGRYALFAIPEKDKWTVILNSQADQWGLAHEKNKDKDVLSVDVPVMALGTPMEQFTMTVSGKDVTMAWDMTKVVIPVKM